MLRFRRSACKCKYGDRSHLMGHCMRDWITRCPRSSLESSRLDCWNYWNQLKICWTSSTIEIKYPQHDYGDFPRKRNKRLHCSFNYHLLLPTAIIHRRHVFDKRSSQLYCGIPHVVNGIEMIIFYYSTIQGWGNHQLSTVETSKFQASTFKLLRKIIARHIWNLLFTQLF